MKPISLVLQPSFTLAALLAVMGVLGCTSLCYLPMAGFIKATLGLLIVFTTIYFAALEALLLLPSAWQRIEVNDRGRVIVTNTHGERFNVSVKSNSYVTRYLTILHVNRLDQVENINQISHLKPLNNNWLNALIRTCKSNSSQIVLLPDSTHQDNLRQLRVWLSWWQHNQPDDHADAEF